MASSVYASAWLAVTCSAVMILIGKLSTIAFGVALLIT